MTEYSVETFDTVNDLTVRLEEISQTIDVKVISLPYWRRDAPRSIGYQYGLLIGRDLEIDPYEPEAPIPRKIWSKSGYCGIGATTGDLWAFATNYAFPTEPTRMEVVSSSANDTADGTGVQEVEICYLDGDGLPNTMTVELDGTTQVDCGENTLMLAVNYFRAYSVGSNGSAVGNIDIRTFGGSGTNYSRIATGTARANNVAFMVPVGMKLTITDFKFSLGGSAANRDKSGVYRLLSNYDNRAEELRDSFFMHFNGFVKDESNIVAFNTPIIFPELSKLRVQVVSHATDTLAFVNMRGYIEQVGE